MKKAVLLLASLLIGLTLANGQNFQQTKGFSFQGYARDFDGAALGSQTIVVRFSIFPEGGSDLYVEEQTLDTDAYGLFSAEIGSVTPNDFAVLDYSKQNLWLRVETKANGSDFAVVSETELLAVPYAKSAENGVPIGTILPFGGPATSIPAGYLACDGTEVAQADYPRLYSVIADAWGTGTGANFLLPDLRGYFLRGIDAGSGNDPDAATRTALAGGNDGDNVGSYQDSENKSHDHGGATTTNGAHTHNYTSPIIGSFAGLDHDTNGSAVEYPFDNAGTTTSSGDHSHTINADGGAESRPKNAYVWFIIKY